MSPEQACESFHEIAPELALGIADGKERADALGHIASCVSCRAYLAELTDVADGLLSLTPSHEPPAGFESRVLGELGIEPSQPAVPSGPRRPWWGRRVVLAGAAALAAAAVTASTLLVAFDDERELAGNYREALASVGGQYFQATRLHDAEGNHVGQVFGYQGEPSWLFIVVYERYRDTRLDGAVTSASGESLPLPGLELDADRGSWGGELPVDLSEIARLTLSGPGASYEAQIPPGPDE